MEAGKWRLAGHTAQTANTDAVKDLRCEACDLKKVVAEKLWNSDCSKKHVGRWVLVN